VLTYFLIGALTGLFARAQAEWRVQAGWSAQVAVDDFLLSTARLLGTLWVSGLAAVGGVLVASEAYDSVTNAGSGSEFAAISGGQPFLLIVAAVSGLAPDLIFRRLTYQVERYNEVLENIEFPSMDRPSNESAEGTSLTLAEETGEVKSEAKATEAAKRKAKALGVDLSTVEGTGSSGRITVKDVERSARAK
jgi:pyruvate/2-oxoglutarate dehydrogenase complex dihydrolipoamide acyltransferase (E2) component